MEIRRDPNTAAEQRAISEMCTPEFIDELRAQVARHAGDISAAQAVDTDN